MEKRPDKNESSKLNENLSGKRFGKLVADRIVGYTYYSGGIRVPQWLCHCDCGTDHVATSISLQRGNTLSCGCLRARYDLYHVTHGESRTDLYHIYTSMISAWARDRNPMRVCEEWVGGKTYDGRDASAGYLAFREWALRHVSEGGGGYAGSSDVGLYRVDDTRDWGPDNCIFCPARRPIVFTWTEDGKPRTMTISQLAKEYGTKVGNIAIRMKVIWSPNAIIHMLKHPELGMTKVYKRDEYRDKDGNTVSVPDYGAKIVRPEN